MFFVYLHYDTFHCFYQVEILISVFHFMWSFLALSYLCKCFFHLLVSIFLVDTITAQEYWIPSGFQVFDGVISMYFVSFSFPFLFLLFLLVKGNTFLKVVMWDNSMKDDVCSLDKYVAFCVHFEAIISVYVLVPLLCKL